MGSKKNLITLLGIAFVVAVIATGLFYGLVVSKMESAATQQRDSIVVAAQDLNPGDVLAPGVLKVVPRAGFDALVEGFESPPEVSGLVVVAPIAEGEPLDRARLASKDSPRGGALGVAPGMRAVSIHVADSTGVIRLLRPGHRVDAQVVSNGGRRKVTLRTILQNLEVLRVEPQPEPSEGRPMLPVVTLIATPEEADALAVADAAARVRLILRHPLDDELTKRGKIAVAEVLANPPKQEQGSRSVSKSAEEPESVETAAARRAAASSRKP